MNSRNRRSKFPLEWTRHIKDEKEKKAFEKSVISADHVLAVLRTVLERKKDDSKKTLTDYSDAAWAYKQADNNGYIRALDQVIDLLGIPLTTNEDD